MAAPRVTPNFLVFSQHPARSITAVHFLAGSARRQDEAIVCSDWRPVRERRGLLKIARFYSVQEIKCGERTHKVRGFWTMSATKWKTVKTRKKKDRKNKKTKQNKSKQTKAKHTHTHTQKKRKTPTYLSSHPVRTSLINNAYELLETVLYFLNDLSLFIKLLHLLFYYCKYQHHYYQRNYDWHYIASYFCALWKFHEKSQLPSFWIVLMSRLEVVSVLNFNPSSTCLFGIYFRWL